VAVRERLRRVIRTVSLASALVLPLTAWVPSAAPVLAAGEVAPNATSLVDCNGFSPLYHSVKVSMKAFCADPFFKDSGTPERAYDNGKYIGHDEPSVKFISSAPGSGNHMTYQMQLATDPVAAPTASGSVTHYAELSIAPWFGLPLCDPRSYPLNKCTPDSDKNTGLGSPKDAGSAFMELQFYAPGFGPFADAGSCDPTFYCAALTIDSLECNFNFVTCNPNCVEPVNFAYIQRDGVPAGPPSPQLADDSTLAPNKHTLMMRGGDRLRVTLRDTDDGLKTTVEDLSTGQTGFMVASAHNGFMNTNFTTCNGKPFNFHPEYSTASQQNQVPWAALEGGVLMQQEIGHFESCSSVTNQLGLSFDLQTYQTCVGGLEPGGTGEGPCTDTGCTGATTQGGGPCPDITTNLCELSDAICAPQGARSVTINGKTETWSWPIAACEQDFFQNGDLDFDGNSYVADWPDGSKNHPTSFKYAGPFDAHGNTYPSIQIETDVAASENNCDTVSGSNCTALPQGAAFYPFWSIGKQSAIVGHGDVCVWNFGNTIPHVTINNLGGVAQYGTPNIARYGGTVISAVRANPQLGGKCNHD
jgi:hypothetical protein